MALKKKSAFLYGLEVTSSNRSIDFKAVSGGPQISASINLGFYSLTDLMSAIASAMNSADLSNTYTVSVNRTINSGTENRITISSSGSYFSLLFGTGTRAASSVASLIGFTASDKTGALTYTGTSSAGTFVLPKEFGYNYIPQEMNRKVFGSLNITASGEKEAIVFQIQKFFQVQFKYEPEAYVISAWAPFMTWAIQQKPLEFTPDLSVPNTVINCTLEKTGADSKGLSYMFKEMLPQFPFFYDSGLMTYRVKE
jgi:hypothetical protein